METLTEYKLEPAKIILLPDWQQEKADAHLQAWFNENHPTSEMLWKEEYSRQCIFVRDKFNILFHDILQRIEVISTHTSKSIKLPVFHVSMKGVDLIMRDNFHDWKVSVKSDTELHFPLELFSKPEEQILHCYCEGYHNDWIYGPYTENKRQFTVEVYDNERMFTFLFLLKLQIENSSFFQK